MKENNHSYRSHPHASAGPAATRVTTPSQSKKRIFVESPNASKPNAFSSHHAQQPIRQALIARNFQEEWNEAYKSVQPSRPSLPFSQPSQPPQQQQHQQQTMYKSRKIFEKSPLHAQAQSAIPTRQSLVKCVAAANSNPTKASLAKQTAYQNQGDISIASDDNDQNEKYLLTFSLLSRIKAPPKRETAQKLIESRRIFAKLVEFLGFSDLLQLKFICKTFASYAYQRVTKRAISSLVSKGISSHENYLLWNSFIQFEHVQAKHELQYYNYTLIPSISDVEIIQDSNRTLISRAEQIEGKRKEKLKKVLRSVSHNVKEIGYVRGMNEIVGALIASETFKENEIYWIMLYLLRQLKLKDVFSEGFPRLNILVFQLRIFMQNYTSEILGFLESHDVPVISFAAKWFLTIFASEFPKSLLMQVWGRLLLDGWKALIQVSIAFLKIFEQEILSCSSADELTSLLKNLAPSRSTNEAAILSNLIPTANSLKITNTMLSSLEKIYEKHPAYLRDSLIILLFRNRNLNDSLEWKILPQAPHFSGQNSTLERLNAHTKVSDYFNELTRMESTNCYSRRKTADYATSHPIQRSAYSNRTGSSQSIHFGSEHKLQEQSNQINREVGILRQISKKLISIFTDDEDLSQQHSQPQQYLKYNSTPITPISQQAAAAPQPPLRYFDQILGEMREIEEERCQTEAEDMIKIGPADKRAHNNHQPKTLKILQCHRREESGMVPDTSEYEGESPAKAIPTQYQSVKKPNYIEVQNRNTRAHTDHDIHSRLADPRILHHFTPTSIPTTPQSKFYEVDKHFSKLKNHSHSSQTSSQQSQQQLQHHPAASASINQPSCFLSTPKPITPPFNPQITSHRIPSHLSTNTQTYKQQAHLAPNYATIPLNFTSNNAAAPQAPTVHHRNPASLQNQLYYNHQPAYPIQLISRK